DVAGKTKRLGELEHTMAEGGVWADPERARQVVDEVKTLKSWLEPYNALRKRLDDARGLAELADAEPDEALARDLDTEAAQIVGDLERLELRNMMRGGDYARDALLTIHPGAGGTESRDWAALLMPRYHRWAEQHVNKTSSAVRITHLPTNIVVSCQQERSQFKNKATALKMLKARLYERAVAEREAKKAEVDKQKTDISWGNQIRSYVFQPYTMVNDHRTELKVADVQKVMDGDLDPFI